MRFRIIFSIFSKNLRFLRPTQGRDLRNQEPLWGLAGIWFWTKVASAQIQQILPVACVFIISDQPVYLPTKEGVMVITIVKDGHTINFKHEIRPK